MNLKKAKFEALKTCELNLKELGKVTDKKYYLPKNVMFESDKLITRTGAKPFDQLIFDSDKTYNVYDHTVFTDCYYYREGQKGRVFIIVDDDETTNVVFHFFIMWSSGESQSIGKIYFTRASETTFGIPESFTLYKGKATRGCGLYLLVRLVYDNGEPDFVRMYELSSDMKKWEYIYTNDYYIPTILAFGRGEKYYLAEEADKRISFSKPIRPETENLLTNVFFAYYTTDGYSSTFELPHKDISDGAIDCVYSDLTDEYTFSIAAGKTQSSVVVIDSKSYKFCCNRVLGNVYFTDANGNKTALPFVGVENNLQIIASRSDNDDLIKLGAMSKCMHISSGGEGKIGQTVIFYGNLLDEGGKVCWINSENPLYFPKSCTATPGDPSNKLQGGYTFNGKLYMYDQENLYSANVHTSESTDLSLILKGISSINKVEYDSFTFTQTIRLPQEILNDSVVVFPTKVLFTGKGRGIYEYSGNSIKRIIDISKERFTPLFATSYKGGYLLCGGREGYYYDLLSERLSFWDFAAELMAGFSFSDDCILFAKCLCKQNRVLIYALRFEGDSDGAISDITTKPLIFYARVQARVICRFNSDDTYYKSLYATVLDTDPKGDLVQVNVFVDKNRVNKAYVNFYGGLKTIRYRGRFKKLEMQVVGEGLVFNGAKIIYYDGKTF